MNEINHVEMDEVEFKKRKELFSYTDLTHPLIQVLFNLQLDEIETNPLLKG